MTAPARAAFTPLTCGNGVSLMAAMSGADLAAAGYVEEELRATGSARSYADHPAAAYATRVVVRRPEGGGSGTLVVEWLNVSSGSDAGPDWTYLAAEIVRRGHTWAGVSAQHVGVEGGPAAVAAGVALQGLRDARPGAVRRPRRIPGDAYAYDIYTQVARGLASDLGRFVRPGGGRVAVGVRADDVRQRRAAGGRGLRRASWCTAGRAPRCRSAMPGRGIDLIERIGAAADSRSGTTPTCR